MKIEDVVKLTEECEPWIARSISIVSLNVGTHDWYYQACGKCGKTLGATTKGRYECGECHHIGDSPKSRFIRVIRAAVQMFLIEYQQIILQEMRGSNSVEASQAVVNLEADLDDHYDRALDEDSVSTKTPGKRMVSGSGGSSSGTPEGDMEGQFSTNKFSRRGGKKGRIQLIDDDN